jgi:hypothetical protein
MESYPSSASRGILKKPWAIFRLACKVLQVFLPLLYVCALSFYGINIHRANAVELLQCLNRRRDFSGKSALSRQVRELPSGYITCFNSFCFVGELQCY